MSSRIARRLAAAVLTTTTLAILCATADAQQPSLVITPRTATVAALDTVYGVTATPRVLGGLSAPTSPVVWSTSVAGIVRLVKNDAAGHSVSLAALAQGSTWLRASWQTFPGTTHLLKYNGQTLVVLDLVTLRDSILVTVTAPTHLITPFNAVFNGAPFFDDWQADSVCVFPLETDRAGFVYTGRSVTWSTGDTLLARLLNSSRCPDTTVDPAKLVLPLPRMRP